MKINKIKLENIRSFKNEEISLDSNRFLVGQNNHGKSSVIKIIEIILNDLKAQKDEEYHFLDLSLVDKILPVFDVPTGKAKRITITCDNNTLHITFKNDGSFYLREKIEKYNNKSDNKAIELFNTIKEKNKILTIPAIRDSSSKEFRESFEKSLSNFGMGELFRKTQGGTIKEYRELKSIKGQIESVIKPFVEKNYVGKIENKIGLQLDHKLAFSLGLEAADILEWVKSNIHLSFDVSGEGHHVPLSESGTGIQSALIFALNFLSHESKAQDNTNFILAIEEPEAYLHPQKQKELLLSLLENPAKNIRYIITTHSPYILSEAEFENISLIKKTGLHSKIITPNTKNNRELDIFNHYNTDSNAKIFFAEKIILVEGESDALVIKELLLKKFGPKAMTYTIIEASGNKNFSPFLNLINSLSEANTPCLVVTDFDSITKPTDRAIIAGFKAAGIDRTINYSEIDSIDETSEYSTIQAICTIVEQALSKENIKAFIFSGDLEYSLITEQNKTKVGEILAKIDGKDTLKTGFSIQQYAKHIGSKDLGSQKSTEGKFKKPYIHAAIAKTIELNNCHPDIQRLLEAIETL